MVGLIVIVVIAVFYVIIHTCINQAKINEQRRATLGAAPSTPSLPPPTRYVDDVGYTWMQTYDGRIYWLHADNVWRIHRPDQPAHPPMVQPGWRPTPGQVVGAGAIGFAAGALWEHHHQQANDLQAAESANYEITMNHILHHPPGWQYPEAQAHHHHH